MAHRSNTDASLIQLVLKAISFSARAHQGQLRKDGKTPYHCHVFRVAFIVRDLFEIDDPAVIQTALLHDTIEDTTTDADDLKAEFGEEVATWVGILSKDKRMLEAERERRFMEAFVSGPWQVQVCKLADTLDNLLDSESLSVKGRKKSLDKAKLYLDALGADLKPEATKAYRIVCDALQRVSSEG